MKEKDKTYFETESEFINGNDLDAAAQNVNNLIDKIKNSNALSKFFNEMLVLVSLLKDYVNGKYRKIPYKALAAIVFTVLYVLNIFDLIPDFLPGIGLLDDATMISICLSTVNTEVGNYKKWKTIEELTADDQLLGI